MFIPLRIPLRKSFFFIVNFWSTLKGSHQDRELLPIRHSMFYDIFSYFYVGYKAASPKGMILVSPLNCALVKLNRFFFSISKSPGVIIGKKVSLRLFDIFQRNMVFIFLWGTIGASNEIDRVSKFDNFLSFSAKQNALWFSVADTQLNKRFCPSIGPRYVGPSVSTSQSGKMSILEAFCECVWVGMGAGWGVGCGLG